MSNTARKARKRAGIKFEKAAKVGTPVKQRTLQTDHFLWRNRWKLSGPAFLRF